MTADVLEVPSTTASDLIDRMAILRLVDNDVPLLLELIAIFMEDAPRLLMDIGTALRDGDAKKLQISAHTLKGSASTFSSPLTYAAANVLEEMGRNGAVIGGDDAVRHLETTLLGMQNALRAFSLELQS